MNLTPQVAAHAAPEDDSALNIAEYFDILFDRRWLIFLISLSALVAGVVFAVLSTPVYESNFSVQVEDSDKSAGSFLGDAASSLLSVKTPSAGEVEVIRSRLILSQVVENEKLYIEARPRYAPIVGEWMARRASSLSDPKFLGFDGFVTGTEKIEVAKFDVPLSIEGRRFVVTAVENGKYSIDGGDLFSGISGTVGQPLKINSSNGGIFLLVSKLSGRPGAQYLIASKSKQISLSSLQDGLKVVEKGKQSGVLDISWQNTDPEKLARVLDEIGRLYIRQNIDRKAAEAEKTLGFLNTELPKFKVQLEQSEDIYNRYRNQNGTVSLDDEAKAALLQTTELQSKLVEAQQKRRELAARFTDRHPSIQTLDAQISAWNVEIGNVDSKIRKMPLLQQSTLRMQRDIKVNTDLYVSLLNSSLQMRLAKEGKVGNVRLLDEPVVPEEPVRPKKSLIVAAWLGIGLLIGIVVAFARSTLFGGIRNPSEIEIHTGLNVYSTIPVSVAQVAMEKDVQNRVPGLHILTVQHPEDAAIESLRSLRTSLQFSMLQANNNRILISGPTPGVGKTFVSINFSAIMAASGKRVLLIDADLRKGRVNQFFSLVRGVGLSELIIGSKTFSEVVRRDVISNLDLVTTGSLPPNPAELLMSESFSRLLEDFSTQYDLVIIDTAPILVASDTASVAPQIGSVLLVARAEKTQLGEINECVRRLAQAGSQTTGVVLNAMDMSRRHSGRYGYKYGAYKYTQYKYNS